MSSGGEGPPEATDDVTKGTDGMKIQILGTGCAKCTKLAELAEQAAREMGLDFEIVKVKDLNEIVAFGVMMTPALAVDGTVKLSGKVPSLDELKKLLA